MRDEQETIRKRKRRPGPIRPSCSSFAVTTLHSSSRSFCRVSPGDLCQQKSRTSRPDAHLMADEDFLVNDWVIPSRQPAHDDCPAAVLMCGPVRGARLFHYSSFTCAFWQAVSQAASGPRACE